MIQDVILTGTGIALGAGTLNALRDRKTALPWQTSLPAAIALSVGAVVYGTLGMPLSVLANLTEAAAWWLILMRRRSQVLQHCGGYARAVLEEGPRPRPDRPDTLVPQFSGSGAEFLKYLIVAVAAVVVLTVLAVSVLHLDKVCTGHRINVHGTCRRQP